MKQFLKNMVVFWCVQGCIAAGMLMHWPRMDNDYMAASVDKMNRLEQTPGGRVLLVGGSSVAFGFDSSIIQQQTGMPTLNMGLHAGQGRDYILNQVLPGVKPGDLVVVSMEYGILFGGRVHGGVLYDAIETRPANWIYVPVDDYPELLDKGLGHLGMLIRRWELNFKHKGNGGPSRPYSRDSFNQWGDVVAHWGLPGHYDPESSPVNREINSITSRGIDVGIGRLNSFYEDCSQRGAHMVFVYPQMDATRFERNDKLTEEIKGRMQADAAFPILIEPAEDVYPTAMFFDTEYHMTREGAQAHTDLVAGRLSAWIERQRADKQAGQK